VLRRSLGVSEIAPTDTRVEPAPPVDPTLHQDEVEDETVGTWGNEKQWVELREELKNKASITMEELDDHESILHDEL